MKIFLDRYYSVCLDRLNYRTNFELADLLFVVPFFVSMAFFIFSFFWMPRDLLIVSSLLFAYPHLFFTLLNISWTWTNSLFSLGLIALLFALIGTNYQMMLTTLLVLQAFHYQSQNYALDSDSPERSRQLFWSTALVVHILTILVLHFKLNVGAYIFIPGALLVVLSSIAKGRSNRVRFFATIWILAMMVTNDKEAFLAIASAWHGVQYIIFSSKSFTLRTRRLLPVLAVTGMGILYSVSSSLLFFRPQMDLKLIIAGLISLNLTHYALDYWVFFKNRFGSAA